MREKVLDMTSEEGVCGDISIHVLEELEAMPPGSILVLRVKRSLGDVEESLRLLEEAGYAEVIELEERNGVVIARIKRK